MEENKKENADQEVKMDGKSKALFIVLAILIVGSVAVTYYKYMVQRDYVIQAATDCDPEAEQCFVWECDPESLVEGEACTGVPDNDIWYYKNIERNASRIPLCDPNDENCDALVCGENEPDCQEVLCTSENVPEGETCNNPEQYLMENPPEECAEDDEECLLEQEGIECEEGDEECLSAEIEECDPDDEECLSAQEEECASDDQECLDAQESECLSDDPADCEEAPADESGSDASGDGINQEDSSDGSSGNINVPPPGVQPQ